MQSSRSNITKGLLSQVINDGAQSSLHPPGTGTDPGTDQTGRSTLTTQLTYRLLTLVTLRENQSIPVYYVVPA